MDIIGAFNRNAFNFDNAGKMSMVGYVSGPLRITLAVAQIALNILTLVCVSWWISDKSMFSAKKTGDDLWSGFGEIGKGIIDLLPFTSIMRDSRCLTY